MKTVLTNNNPYEDVIVKYLNLQFPQVFNRSNKDNIEALSSILIGSKEIRYGSVPSPEIQVEIRKVIKECLNFNKPIPILIPWGSLKGDGSSNIDLAEVSAINRIVELNKAVKQFHPEGIEVSMRIEDTSGLMLFSYDMNKELVQKNSFEYCENLINLIDILDEDKCIVPSLESKMKNKSKFKRFVNKNLPLFEKYLMDTHNCTNNDELDKYESYKDLFKIYWTGIIPIEQRQHYYDTYKRLYPNESTSRTIGRLALYFSQSLARYQLDMSGALPHWDNFINISFVSPIKGLPEGLHTNRLYYRTLPLSQARTHICPWRGKGYLQISGNEACAKITSFNNEEIKTELLEQTIFLNSNSKNIPVRVDCLILY